MPLWGSRGSYWAVTMTLVIVVGVNVLVDWGRPLVPPPAENELASESAQYLLNASRHRVEWLTLADDFLAEARRLDRPIMIAVGTSWSRTARRYDSWHFSNQEMAAKLNSEFVCVRVDAMQNPEWAYPLLQLTRSTVPNDDGFHLWFLLPDGGFILWDDRLDVNEFREVLGRVLDARARLVEESLAVSEDELRELQEEEDEQQRREQQRRERQRREMAAYGRAGSQQTPKYREYAESAMAVDLRFVEAESIRDRAFDLSMIAAEHRFEAPPASRLRLYLKLGARNAAERLVRELLQSGQVDWLDGGFFRVRDRRDAGQVDFNKLLAQSTEMCAALAQYSTSAQDRTAEQVALAGVEWALRMLESGSGLPGSSVADVLSNGRCLAYSFPVATLRLSFSRSVRKSMTEKLLLNSRANPLMMVRRPAGADWSLEDVDELMDELRSIREQSAIVPSDHDYADAVGYTVARCIETCRLLGNDELLTRAMAQLTALETFRVGSNTVRHGLSGASRSHRYLGDFAAYADAMLEAFTASGDAAYLSAGSAVLDRAVFLYSDDSGRVLGAQPASGGDSQFRLDVPHLLDGFVPPATVKTILLMWQYGELLERADLKTKALEMLNEYGHVLNEYSRFEVQFGGLTNESGQTVVEYSSAFDDFYRTAAEILER